MPQGGFCPSMAERIHFATLYMSDTKAILQEVDLNIGDKSLLSRSDVVGLCHGLFCLDLGDHSIGIWNPSLGELRRLPAGHIDDWAEIGFGYDHSTQDYKIVMLIPPDSSKAQVWSFKSGLFRMIDVPCFKNSVMCHIMREPGTLVGENIYREVFFDNNLTLAGSMLSFNLVSETLNYCPGPSTRGQQLPLVLDEFRGGLCTIGIEDGKLGDELVIWSATHEIEKGVIKSWSKIFTLSWGIIEGSISPRVDISWLRTAVVYEGLLLLSVVGVGREAKLLAYNFEENSLRLVETSLAMDTSALLQTYTETLVPLPPAVLIN